MIDFTIFKKPKYSVAVVIPIYKSELTEYEKVSLDRCLQVLGTHPIIVIAPDELSVETIHSLTANNNIAVEQFDNSYFKNVDSYSKLLLLPDFYRRFTCYKYILIYQLDAFVFSDSLLEWCSLGYDYIGAPWINIETPDLFFNRGIGKYLRLIGITPKKVGNGGFSLRKIRSALIVLMIMGDFTRRWPTNEDIFWSIEVPKYSLGFFKIPDASLAKKFSIELEPKQCFKDNGNILPFGCHAWEKYDIDFWRPFLKESGYII